ncbi:MAG TPA: hypothetical protein PLG17_11595, partial [Thermodesulfobacteriota bacterium]|nr:hypothetical protein [Thermodesulfobacteriota bacterium]
MKLKKRNLPKARRLADLQLHNNDLLTGGEFDKLSETVKNELKKQSYEELFNTELIDCLFITVRMVSRSWIPT